MLRNSHAFALRGQTFGNQIRPRRAINLVVNLTREIIERVNCDALLVRQRNESPVKILGFAARHLAAETLRFLLDGQRAQHAVLPLRWANAIVARIKSATFVAFDTDGRVTSVRNSIRSIASQMARPPRRYSASCRRSAPRVIASRLSPEAKSARARSTSARTAPCTPLVSISSCRRYERP